jgi:hypothetical protein
VTEITREESHAVIGDSESRKIALTTIGKVDVSTVFLCVNHNYSPGAPILFETMTFGDNEGHELQ